MNTERVTIGLGDLMRALREAGIGNRPVCLHSSLGSHGRVDGGAATVIDAFAQAGATLLVPTFTGTYEVTAPASLRPPRNGVSYRSWPDRGGMPLHAVAAASRTSDTSGTSGTTDTSHVFTTADNGTEMGAIPAEVLIRPGRARGNHPLCSFTAIGPEAAGLVRGQTSTQVSAPLAALADRGGLVALAGVGLTRMTLLHYAEQVAGRVLFRRWARVDGEVAMVAVGGCSEGFERFADALAPVETTVTVGRSLWRVFPAAAVVDIVSAVIRHDPGSTRCPQADCERCADAVLGGPLLES